MDFYGFQHVVALKLDEKSSLYAAYDYIGVAARGSGGAGNSRAYVGHTNDSRLGLYNGAMNGDSNNHVSKVTY